MTVAVAVGVRGGKRGGTVGVIGLVCGVALGIWVASALGTVPVGGVVGVGGNSVAVSRVGNRIDTEDGIWVALDDKAPLSPHDTNSSPRYTVSANLVTAESGVEFLRCAPICLSVEACTFRH